jgi:hypothetical protein
MNVKEIIVCVHNNSQRRFKMSSILAWVTAHGWSGLLAVFTAASIVLTAAASVLAALGDSVPGWLGTAISWIAAAIHFVNGNVPAASAAVAPTPPASP